MSKIYCLLLFKVYILFLFISAVPLCPAQFGLLCASIVGRVWQSSSVASEGSADKCEAELPSESMHSKANERQEGAFNYSFSHRNVHFPI